MNSNEKMKLIRLHKGLTQKDVAERIGTSKQNYSQYEIGKRSPKLPMLEKIAYALSCSILDLQNDTLLNSEQPIKKNIEFHSLALGLRIDSMYDNFLNLNADGQQKAIEMIRILAMVPEYQKGA